MVVVHHDNHYLPIRVSKGHVGQCLVVPRARDALSSATDELHELAVEQIVETLFGLQGCGVERDDRPAGFEWAIVGFAVVIQDCHPGIIGRGAIPEFLDELDTTSETKHRTFGEIYWFPLPRGQARS